MMVASMLVTATSNVAKIAFLLDVMPASEKICGP